MRLPRPVSHVLFDLDGLLLDTEGFYTAATQRIVGRFGKTFDWSLKSRMIGRPSIESARFLVDALALPMTPEAFLEERETALESMFPGSEPMPGAKELSTALADAGVPIAVASSSNRHLFDLKAERHRAWLARFSAIVLGDDPRIARGKPHPDIFLLAASELGAPPASCLVVEDSPAGLAAGKAAGMQVLAVPYPGLDPDKLAGADLLVRSLSEIGVEDLVATAPA